MHQINVLPLLEKLGIDFDKEKFIAFALKVCNYNLKCKNLNIMKK